MDFITIVIIAVGLAMDALAVSIVSGSVYKQLHVRHALRIALFFGGFQAFMPLIGSLAGISVKEYIADYDHWIAFGLLAAVGCKMLYESFKITSAEKNLDPSNVPRMSWFYWFCLLLQVSMLWQSELRYHLS
jgi:putative Mn2+ efflux pump MntP